MPTHITTIEVTLEVEIDVDYEYTEGAEAHGGVYFASNEIRLVNDEKCVMADLRAAVEGKRDEIEQEIVDNEVWK